MPTTPGKSQALDTLESLIASGVIKSAPAKLGAMTITGYRAFAGPNPQHLQQPQAQDSQTPENKTSESTEQFCQRWNTPEHDAGLQRDNRNGQPATRRSSLQPSRFETGDKSGPLGVRPAHFIEGAQSRRQSRRG